MLADQDVEGFATEMPCYGFKKGEFDPDSAYRQCPLEHRRMDLTAPVTFMASRLFERLVAA